MRQLTTTRGQLVLTDLVPDPDNPKRHPQANLEAIQASLEAFGQVPPLVVQAGTNIIIAGNATAGRMASLGMKSAEVVLVECTDDERRRLSIILNRAPELGQWDDTQLATTIAELQQSDGDFDPTTLGWDDAGIDAIMASLAEEAPLCDDWGDDSVGRTELIDGHDSADVREVRLVYTPDQHGRFLAAIQALDVEGETFAVRILNAVELAAGGAE